MLIHCFPFVLQSEVTAQLAWNETTVSLSGRPDCEISLTMENNKYMITMENTQLQTLKVQNAKDWTYSDGVLEPVQLQKISSNKWMVVILPGLGISFENQNQNRSQSLICIYIYIWVLVIEQSPLKMRHFCRTQPMASI